MRKSELTRGKQRLLWEDTEKCIGEIIEKLDEIITPVADYYGKLYQELEFIKGVSYMPTPFEVAKFYGLRLMFVRIEMDAMPSYLKSDTIYISDKFGNESYGARILCAHELGHYFLHDGQMAAMNNDELNKFFPEEIRKEYEANVFSILLMPQIMRGYPWKNLAPRVLNSKMYEEVFKKTKNPL